MRRECAGGENAARSTMFHVTHGYAGATSRMDPDDLGRLDDRRWGFQQKHDGAYAEVRTDAAGVIAAIATRQGRGHDAADVGGLVGLAIGLPDAVLAGELEASTERGIAARAARGWAAVHLFDLIRWCGCDVGGESYAQRYALLHRWQATVEEGAVPRRDWWSRDAQGDAHDERGRYVRPVPRDLRRLPISPLARGRAGALQLLDRVMAEGGEGLVAVRLDAPLGAPGAKRKVKPTDTLDCVVIAAQGGVATVEHVRDRQRFTVSARGRAAAELAAGDVVEIAAEGRYASGIPRHPRIVRVRSDVASTISVC